MQSGAQKKLAGQIAELWVRFRPTNLERVSVLERAAESALSQTLNIELRKAAAREAHKLAGSLGTFGLQQGTVYARTIENFFRQENAFDEKSVLELSKNVVALRVLLESTPRLEGVQAPGKDLTTAPGLLLAHAGGVQGEKLLREIVINGVEGTLVSSIPELRKAVSARRPELVVIDSALLDNATGMNEIAREFSAEEIPLLVLSDSPQFSERLQAMRLGIDGCLEEGLSPQVIASFIADKLRKIQAEQIKVLALDDDPLILDLLRLEMAAHHIRYFCAADPDSFWQQLPSISPDFIILDLNLPNANGIEVCRLLRKDLRWRETPVLVLTSHKDADTVQNVFEAGADDYIAKPILGPELHERLINRLERIRLRKQFNGIDPVTTLLTRQRFLDVVDQFAKTAPAAQKSALVLLDFLRFQAFNHEFGYEAGDSALKTFARTLKNTLRADDLMARWGTDEFALALPGTSREEALERIVQLQTAWQRAIYRTGLKFDFVISEHLNSELNIANSMKILESQLTLKLQGIDPAQSYDTDVVLVEDDEAIAGLLMQSLNTRGYKVEWITNGQQAASLLLGPDAKFHPKVILLDVDLPGLDGFTLLQRLRGKSRHTRVIMVTVRASDAEILDAFNYGAFDYVPKPFSVPILINRIQRALDSL